MSDDNNEWIEWIIEINTLEELLELQKEVGHEIIIGSSYNQNSNSIEDSDWGIEIYNGYRE